jgi:epoxyqueuosine reductase
MSPVYRSDITARIIAQAKTFGASLAGMVRIGALEGAPSYDRCGLIPRLPGAGSLLVLALVHEPSRPELDWWDDRKGGTPGNRRMEETAMNLARWLKEELTISATLLPYHMERGGVFLKDAAILAGLGVIGKNNLLLTPQFGPRVRLRAMLVEVEVEPPETLEFNPCARCCMPCTRACPREAFARDSYDRLHCSDQMKENEANRVSIAGAGKGTAPRLCTLYCRACELACPVAR